MRIDERIIADVVVVGVSGDIVLDGSGPALANRVRSLLDQGRQQIVLDLGQVRYVDSSGLGQLVEALGAARNRGGAVKLAEVTSRLGDLLAMTRVRNVFDCFETREEAVASFRAPVVSR